MGERLSPSSRVLFLLLLVWDLCADALLSLGENAQRSDSQGYTSHIIPMVTEMCARSSHSWVIPVEACCAGRAPFVRAGLVAFAHL